MIRHKGRSHTRSTDNNKHVYKWPQDILCGIEKGKAGDCNSSSNNARSSWFLVFGLGRLGQLTTRSFSGHFLRNPSQPMSTTRTVFSFVRAFATYLYRGSFPTEPALGEQIDSTDL